MEMMREITDWEWPNHDFIFDGSDKIVAQRVNGVGEWKVFKTGLRFSKQGRKFTRLKEHIPTHIRALAGTTKKSDVIIVKGSKGNEYTIVDGKCSCPGYTYRGHCRHIENLKNS